MRHRPIIIRPLVSDARGAAIVEFAFVLPLFIMLLWGVMGYGQYFLIAHSAQELANDAARATVAGLSSDERRTIAQASVASEVASLGAIDPARVSTLVSESSDAVTVSVRVDASAVPLLRTSFVPMPSSTIERRAVVRLGTLT